MITLLALLAADPLPVANQATEEWYKCVFVAAAQMTASSEPADTVAEAALGACATAEGNLQSAWQRVPGGPADANIGLFRQDAKGRVLARIIAARMAQAKSR